MSCDIWDTFIILYDICLKGTSKKRPHIIYVSTQHLLKGLNHNFYEDKQAPTTDLKCLFTIWFAAFCLLASAQNMERSLNNVKWVFRNVKDKTWHPAKVPGTVHTDLLNNHLIPDPYFRDNEKSLQWIDTAEWEYQCNIDITKQEFSKDHIELNFKGLDTYAKVYLNNVLIIQADNMFRAWSADIKPQARIGNNILRIIFASATKRGKEEATKLPYTLPGEDKVFTRKAQYQYGWDWGPRFITCGIWKDVQLKCWNTARIHTIQSVQETLTDSLAVLLFHLTIESDLDGNANISIATNSHLPAQSNFSKLLQLKKGVHQYAVKRIIKNPKRWWCNGLGNPYLYSFSFKLKTNSLLDEKTITIGLRTIEWVNEKDSIGTSFYFKVNGKPVFMKGANFIPLDNFIPRVSKGDYQWMVKNAAAANMNMLRVWGGGIYEQDDFYEQCDRNGILVWQDFMFACAMYPGDSAFINNVSVEAKEQVERLSNHPCIALWCGNNEVDEGWENWGWQKQYNYSPKDSSAIARNYDVLFNHRLKDIVATYGHSWAYWPSSPGIGWGRKESLLHGDSHYWGVWWGMEPFETYNKKTGRFVSEYGFQGMPAVTTLSGVGIFKTTGDSNRMKEKMNPSFAEIDSAVLKVHQKHPTGFETINTYLLRDYKMPKNNFVHYTYISQLLQADGLRTAIEAHRRNKPYCMGSLYWQLNDCWPVTSWSTIDYRHHFKAAHYQVKRSFKDVIISVTENHDSCFVYIISDLQRSIINARLTISLNGLDGKVFWSKVMRVVIDSNASKMMYAFPKSILDGNEVGHLFMHTIVGVHDGASILADNVHYFVQPKDLQLQKPDFTLTEGINHSVQSFTINSSTLMKNAMITIENQEINLSDNFVDLLPDQPVTFYLPKMKRIKHLKDKIKIVSLFDTYQP